MRAIKIDGSEKVTNRTEVTKKFFNELEKYNVLSAKDEVEIAEKAAKGDKKSLDKLVLHNMRFVVSVAKQYQYKNNKIPLDDIIAWGLLGCMKAVHHFDPQKGFKFISYAVWWIRQSIIEGIKTHKNTIHIPVNQDLLINKVVNFIDEYYKMHGEMPSDAEIADKFYWSVEDVKKLKHYESKKGVASLNKKIKEGELTEKIDFLEGSIDVPDDNECSEHNEFRNLIKSKLNKREYAIIVGRFFNEPPRNYHSIGYDLNLTSERVRQLERVALKKLKKFNEIKNWL